MPPFKYIWQAFATSHLCLLEDVDPVEGEVLEAPAEVLLVPEEELVERAHASHQHAVVDVQLVVAAGDGDTEKNARKSY